MDDLVQWLREQLDDDERTARAVEDHSAPWDGRWMADGDSAVRTANGHVLFYRHDSGPLKPGLADYVAEWDPARVLREIDAKRQILRQAFEHAATIDGEWGCCHDAEAIEAGYCEEQRPNEQPLLRLLALPYTDRTGYRDEWRP